MNKIILIALAMVLGLLMNGCVMRSYQEEWSRLDDKQVPRPEFVKDDQECHSISEKPGEGLQFIPFFGPMYTTSDRRRDAVALRYEQCMNQRGYYKRWKVEKGEVGCATQTPVTVMPRFTTEAGRACARNCQATYAQCSNACSGMVGGAATAKQREQCLNNCNQILKDCYSSCE